MHKKVDLPLALEAQKFLTRACLVAASLAVILFCSSLANSTEEMAAADADAVAALDKETAASVDRGRKIYRDKADCADCHGWDGKAGIEGEKAPALYQNPLTAEEIHVAILGHTAASSMSERQLNDLATYVVQIYKLQEMSLEECEKYFAPDDPNCAPFRI